VVGAGVCAASIAVARKMNAAEERDLFLTDSGIIEVFVSSRMEIWSATKRGNDRTAGALDGLQKGPRLKQRLKATGFSRQKGAALSDLPSCIRRFTRW
jgi:hypothetical protein